MYLEHFKFKEMPFSLTPNVALFCGLKGHEEALNTLLFSVRSGEGFIKIVGEVGAGKTLLCRKLMDTLGEEYVTAYLPNPDLTPVELRKAFARELSIDLSGMQDQHALTNIINQRLVELHHSKKGVILLVDEAQALTMEGLETLRLLTNIETEKTKLLQIVLFGQPELDELLARRQLRQLQQRITFSYYLPLMSREDLDVYLLHRLTTVGHTTASLFSKKTKDILYQASKGIPRLVNILCHKSLLVAYGQGELQITPKMMLLAVKDTQISYRSARRWILTVFLLLTCLFSAGWFFYKGIV